ncbi:MAG: rRNA methyltransferase [Micavibrio sp.]|nr:rRNA methyltransferase [Micavibrio sp.]|tara:strand:+ start:1548 stop:2207 length:660 start_codon:yes stop_codon:yes gene_type:complete
MVERNKFTKVKTAQGRKNSSTRWLQRQLNDPYVKQAKADGYRSRAAYKLIEMEKKLKLIKKGMLVVDLGAAPGGWTQVAVESGARVVGIDLLEIPEIPGADLIQMDFMADEAPEKLIEMMGGEKADVVLSDLSPYTTGHQKTDHIRIMGLVELAYDFAAQVLKPNGHFLAKVFQGGTQGEVLDMLKKDFKTVKHMKPPASRKESPEQYVVAQGFRGAQN